MLSKKIVLSTLVAGILSFGCGAQADGIKLIKTTDGSEFKIEGKGLKGTPAEIEQNKNFYIEAFGEEAYKQAIATF